MRIEKKEFEALMKNASIINTRRVYDAYADECYTEYAFMYEEDGIPMLCFTRGYSHKPIYRKRIYPHAEGIMGLIMDDMFLESIINLYVEKGKHITDILHWLMRDNFNLTKMPFDLFDIIDCDYEFES